VSKCWHGAPLTRKTCLTPYTTRSHDCEWINRCWLNCKYPLIARHRGSCDHANGIQQQTLHPKTKTFLWWILEGDRKAFIIFGHKGKCRRKWNSIYGRKRKRTFIFSRKTKTKVSDNISVFFFLFHTFNHQVSPTMRHQYLVQFRLFCRWSLLMRFHFPRVQCIDIFVAFF